MVPGRLGRAAALMAGSVAYFSRPWSCGPRAWEVFSLIQRALRQLRPSWFRCYDRLALGLAFGPLVFWLAQRVVAVTQGSESGFDPPLRPQVMLGALLVALLIGAPTLTQIVYLRGLPVVVTRPVIALVVVWATTVAAFWVVFVRRMDAQHIAEAIKRRALLLAALMTVPKVLMIGSWVFRAA